MQKSSLMKARTSFLKLFTSFLLMIFVSLNLHGQSLKGIWLGNFGGPDKCRIILHIDSTQYGYQMKIDFPDDNRGSGIPTTNFTFDKFSFKFRLDDSDTFEGSIDPGYRKITGLYKFTKSIQKFSFIRDTIPPDETSIQSIKAKYNKQEVSIPMRDGTKLFTSIYTPKDTSQLYPMLMFRTPYCSEPGGKDSFSRFLSWYYRFIKENYIMVFQDVRGRYMSEGKFEDIRPFIADKKSNKDIDEASDTYDAVDWLVKNIKHNNGKMGVMGISYPGFYSTMAILSGHPAIKAVSPQAPIADWFKGDDEHHNGAFFLLDNFGFVYSNERVFKAPTRKGFPGFKWPVTDNYQFFLDMGPIKNITTKYFGDSIKIWKDDMTHPNYDDFWKARDPRQYLKNVGPAVMTVGGWFDAEDLYGTLHTYQAIEKQNPKSHPNFLVMGPWFHSQWMVGKAENLGNIYWGQDANKSYQELEVKFFDYYLRDKGKGEFPEATIFITGTNKWCNFSTWPPANITDQKLYLQPNGKLAFTPAATSESFDEYISDPMKPVPYSEKVRINRTLEYMTDDQRFASRRPDVMVYETDTLSQDLTLTGPLTADLFVSTSGTDADYVVKLIDVFPQKMQANTENKIEVPLGGYQMLIRADVFRGRYRNSFEKPEPFKPGEVTEVKYEMPDIAHSFKKGHRIMIQVQNSWFPLVDRNPQKFVDIYHCSQADFQKATHRIYHDKKRPSYLQVKVLNQETPTL
jgi:putative CocE/NonD family hydrolase